MLLFFSSRRRHTRWPRDWSSDVCSSDLTTTPNASRGARPSVSPWRLRASHQITAAHRAKVSRTDTRLSPWTRRYPAISGEPIIAWTASGSGSTVTCSSDCTSTARAPRSCRPRAGAAAAALPPGEAGTEAGGSEAGGREADGSEADGREAGGSEAGGRDAAGGGAGGGAGPGGRGGGGVGGWGGR